MKFEEVELEARIAYLQKTIDNKDLTNVQREELMVRCKQRTKSLNALTATKQKKQ